MRSSKSRLVDAAMPFVLQGATALALAALLAGCDCTTRFLIPIDAEEGDALKRQFQGDDLPDAMCDDFCIPPAAAAVDGGPPPKNATEAGFAVTFCHVVKDGAESAVYCEGSFPDRCIGGRRPARLAPRTSDDPCGSGLDGASFAALARMESASVLAFVELAIELHAHGAPATLVRRALGAAVDEVRHADAASRLARRHGAAPETAVVALSDVRSLDGILLDNAVEGLARETWGALTMAAGARAATDPVVKRTLAAIASDEADHAELARAIDAWASPRTRPATRARARDARIAEVESLLALAEANAITPSSGLDGERAIARARAFARPLLT